MPINPRSAAPITIAACLDTTLVSLYFDEGIRYHTRSIRADDPIDTLCMSPVANCVEEIMRITETTD